MKKFKVSLIIKKVSGFIGIIVMSSLLGALTYVYLTASWLVITEQSESTWVMLGSNEWFIVPLSVAIFYFLAAFITWSLVGENWFRMTKQVFKYFGETIISWGYE